MRYWLLLSLLLLGCGENNSTADSISPGSVPAPVGVGTVTVRHSQSIPARYRLFGSDGQAVAGPLVFESASVHTLTALPGSGVTLEAESLDSSGQAVGHFVTQVDLSSGSATLENPAFVAAESSDPTVESFVTFGCNRVQHSDILPSIPSTANTAQLTQDFAEILKLAPVPGYLFFTGDLVVNLEPGSPILEQQLLGWKQFYQASLLGRSSVKLVPLVGNHEMLMKNSADAEVPNPLTPPIWVSQMADYIRGDNGPTTAAPNPDGLTQDQSRLSYTFIHGDTAYVALNTDTFIDDTTTGDVPLNWLEEQLNSLNGNPSVKHIFVFGHRPVNSPDADNPGIRQAEAQAFERLLNAGAPGSNAPTKVRAYLCAHAHLWTQFKIGGIHQVICGNGGSKAEKAFVKNNGYFGYTVVKRKRSGKFHVESYGRPIPVPYDSTAPQPTSTQREKFSISP